ncbi:uncharacterized protein LOC136026033 [Artemia franciscana]|uniref:uncharacterized protein LOC136026033 n=1 Tax=Artemia franciscana TaxID=6661 RepID=UPI0032DBEF28
MDGKSLRIIRPKIEVEPYGITLPLKSGGFIKIEDEENVPYPSGFEEVVSMPCRPTSDSEDSGISDEMEFFKPARKRQRLEHLSTEEKVARRKLRNRVAAQTARDKKKARLDHLEIVVRGLQQKNEMLQKENRQLWEANKQLMEENSHLVQTNEKLVRIEESFCTKSTKHSSPKTSSFESAALINDLLPKGQGEVNGDTLLSIRILHCLLAIFCIAGKVVVQKSQMEARKVEMSLRNPMTGYRLFLMMSVTVYYNGLCRALRNRRKPPDASMFSQKK